jgi:hypothetical protein
VIVDFIVLAAAVATLVALVVLLGAETGFVPKGGRL